MKKTIITLIVIFTFIVLFAGCPSQVSDDPETTPGGVYDNSSANHISLKAQDDGILITVTRDENWSDTYTTYLYLYKINDNSSDDISQTLGIHANNSNWQDNKVTILYPFTEIGKRYLIRLYTSSNGGQIEEYVSIVATGGIGENPKLTLLNQIEFEPIYDSSSKHFSVNLNTTERILSELVGSVEINDSICINNVSLRIDIYQHRYQGSGAKSYGGLYFSSSSVPEARSYEIPKDDRFDDVQNTPHPNKFYLSISISMEDLITNGVSVQNRISKTIEGYDFSMR